MPKLHQPGFEEYPRDDENVAVVITEDGVTHAGTKDDVERDIEIRTKHLVKELRRETGKMGADILYLTGVKDDFNYEDLEPTDKPKTREQKAYHIDGWVRDSFLKAGWVPKRSHHTKPKVKK